VSTLVLIAMHLNREHLHRGIWHGRPRPSIRRLLHMQVRNTESERRIRAAGTGASANNPRCLWLPCDYRWRKRHAGYHFVQHTLDDEEEQFRKGLELAADDNGDDEVQFDADDMDTLRKLDRLRTNLEGQSPTTPSPQNQSERSDGRPPVPKTLQHIFQHDDSDLDEV
jgi:hypothetical protein